MELRARRRVGLDLRRPADRHRVARAAEMRGEELGPLVGRAPCPRPAGVILVVGQRRSEHVQAAQGVERRDVLLGRGGYAVLRQQLADRAVLALRRGAVVAPDVEDQRVLAVAERLDLVDQPADLHVDMLGEAGGHFHQAALEGLLILRDAVPGGHGRMARRQLGVGGNPALRLGAVEDPLAVGVPAVVELALILVGPFLHDVVRAVDRAAGPVHVERLVGLEGFVPAQPADGVVGQVFAEVIALLGRPGRQDAGGVADQVWLVLRGLAGEESVEIFEAHVGRPVLERTCGGGLHRRRVVPLAEGAGAVAVVLEDLGGERAALRDRARRSRPSRWPARRSVRWRRGDDCVR